jgi:hypothetical protein
MASGGRQAVELVPMNVIVACVRAGTLYPFEYVTKLRNMVGRHLEVPFELVCFTDQAEQCEGATFIDTSQSGLSGWWQKLLLFEPSWRGHNRVIYLDLDTVIVGDITPLARVPGEFAILETPVRKIDPRYPCKFNSSVMTIGGGMASFVWSAMTGTATKPASRSFTPARPSYSGSCRRASSATTETSPRSLRTLPWSTSAARTSPTTAQSAGCRSSGRDLRSRRRAHQAHRHR